MKKLILLCVIVFSMCAVSASAQSVVKVKFAKDNYIKTIPGSVKGSNYIDYVIHFDEFAQIGITLTSGSKTVKFSISKPNGDTFENGVEVRKFDGECDKSGNYKIRVYNTNSESGVTKFRIKFEQFMGT